MFKKFSIVIMCIVMLLSFVACSKDDSRQNDSEPNQTEISSTNDTSKEEIEAVFNTKNIKRITFYGYYGQGKGSDVPAENMTEITNWLGSFTIGEKAPELLPPGTNAYYVEVEYLGGTKIKKGLDVIAVDGIGYYLKSDKTPDCFMEIMSKTSLD